LNQKSKENEIKNKMEKPKITPTTIVTTTSATKRRRRHSSAPDHPLSLPKTPETLRQALPTKPPQKGDRFRVFCDVADDVFGKSTERARGYFFCTVLSVSLMIHKTGSSSNHRTSSKYRLKVKFDDGVTDTVEYPCSEDGAIGQVERLVPPTTDQDQSHQESSSILMGEISGDFAADMNPARLDVGDLVLCQSQNRDKRYRGRIAYVSADRDVCDIAYDDGEYEMEIPTNQGKITLLQDGRSFLHWMEGLPLKFPIQRSRRKAQVTIRLSPDSNDDDETICLVHSNGTTEQQPFERVVAELFAGVKSKCTTKLTWPDIQAADSSCLSPSRSQTARYTPRSAAKSSRGKHRASNACRPEHFVSDPWMQDDFDEDDDDDNDEQTTAIQPREISNSIRNSFWKAMNSSEGHFGADLLFQMTNMHNQIPNKELCGDLVELLWRGPCHRNTYFPDAIRMELVTNYFCSLRTTPGMAARLAESLSQSFVSDFLEQVRTPATIYCAEGDESRTTSAALQRTGQTLSVKNSGAALLCFLLQSQMNGYSQFGKHASGTIHSKQQMDEFKATLHGRALTRDIFEIVGTSNALKMAVKATVSLLAHYGHYLTSGFCFPSTAPTSSTMSKADKIPPHATSMDRAFVASEIRKLLKVMGRICGYLAWLNSIEQGKSLYETKYAICDAIESVLDDVKFDPSLFLSGGSKQKQKELETFWKEMKLQFTLSLDKRISGQLGFQVAELLGLPTTYPFFTPCQ